MLIEILVNIFGALGHFLDDLGDWVNFFVFVIAQISFMPSLEYAVVAWVLRLAGIGLACYLWYLSVKLFKKNRWIIPAIVNLFAYCILFIACFEVNGITYQCESMDCLHEDIEIYFGILGACVFKAEWSTGICPFKDTERQLWKATEIRLWGGFIPALPLRVEIIHKLYTDCPCCGSAVAVGGYTLPKCKNCSERLDNIETPNNEEITCLP